MGGYLIMILIATTSFRKILRPSSSVQPSISIVIAARNEENSLPALLEKLSSQRYPGEKTEVIIVDDHSEDSSAAVIQDWVHRQEGIDARYAQSLGKGKKAAITTGVSLAKGEWILQTDADCLPGDQWMEKMAAAMTAEIHFLSGPIRLREGKTWLTKLQALEMAGLVTLGAGSLAAGFPNMANGANMAYRRKTFMDLGGFEKSNQIASGDDEFLLQSVSLNYPNGLAFVKDPEAIVETDAVPDWAGFVSQRIRWVSKARGYEKRSTNLIQLMSWFGFVAFLYWGIMGFFAPVAWEYGAGLFLAKVVVDRWLMASGTVFLQRRRWLKWLIFLEIVYIPYVIWIGIRGNLSSHYSWKGRNTT